MPAAATSPVNRSQQAGATSVLTEIVPLDAKLAVPALPAETPSPEFLSAAFDALEPLVSTGRYDLEAEARALASSIENSFAFVRDQIRYEAYPGVLRDAEGTLAAGAGNAFDRSRLLARLLQSHGITTRFATDTLPKARVDALFARIFDGFTAPPSLADAARQSTFFARVLRRASRDYPVIRGAIGSALSDSVAVARTQALDDIARHVWYRPHRRAVAGPRYGICRFDAGPSYAPVSQTVETMPDNWYQRVSIRVLTERLVDGQLQLAPVLTVTRPVVELASRDVFLLHAPAPKETMGLGVGGAAGADWWTPTLLVGDDTEKGDAIDFGESEGSSGFTDALGGGSSSTFVAEWIEFEVLQPGGRHDVTRRTLVDRATQVWRAATPLQADTLQPLPRDDKGFFGPKALHHLLFSTGPQNLGDYFAGAMLVALGDETLFGSEALPIDQLFPMAIRDQSSLVWTDNVITPGINDTPSVNCTATRRVFAWSVWRRVRPAS